jgi:DNA polymerase-3 subunit chi
MEIAFYQLRVTPLIKTLPRLVEKAYSQGQRGVIVCDSQTHLSEFNSALWTFSKRAFIPHGSAQEGVPAQDQPFWLTCTLENPNNARVAFITNGCVATATLGFTKVCDFVDGHHSGALEQTYSRFETYEAQGFTPKWWVEQDDGRWASQNLTKRTLAA